jgi:hypothetical protein
MPAKRDLTFRYLGDSKSLAKASGRAEKSLGGVDKKARGAGKGMGVMSGGVARLGLLLGGAVLIGGAKKAIARAEEMGSAYAATEQIIKTTGGSANLTGAQIKGMAKEMSLKTGVDKASIIEGQNLLLTFKNIREETGAGNDIFSRASEIMLDFSAVMKTDAKSAALGLGKALNNPIKGVSQLARVGVEFTDQQKEQIRVLQESGDLLGAQGIILAELEGQVGGVAAATADSTAKISNAWKEVTEEIGNILLPAVDALVPAFQAVGREAPSATRKIGLGFSQIARQTDKLTGALDFMLGPIINLNDGWDDQQEILFQIDKRMIQYTEGVAAGKDAGMLFASVLGDLNAKGDFTVGTFQAMKEATGITAEEFESAAAHALRYKDELGLTEEQADLFKRELNKLAMGTSDLSVVTEDAEGSLDAFDDELGDVKETAADAAAALVTLATKTKELADPVFKAEQATIAFEEALAAAQEDLIITAEEAHELGKKYGEMQTATEAVSGENIEAYETNVTAALGRADDNVEIHKGNLRSVPAEAREAFRRTQGAFDELIDKGIQVNIRASLPTQAEMDRAVRRAIERAGRIGVRYI